jgi:hypothetical protein
MENVFIVTKEAYLLVNFIKMGIYTKLDHLKNIFLHVEIIT